MLKKNKYKIAPEFSDLESWITQLPANFASSGETIYKLRNEIKVFVVGNLQLNVKEFKVPILLNRILYLYFRGSKAERSYKYAQLFTSLGIPTPAPVGYIECSENGLLTKCYYVSLHLNYNYTLREALDFQDKQKKDILKQWVRFTYEKLHKNEIFHLDYSPGNTLITGNSEELQFSIVDLNRISFGKINFEKGLTNFCRLGVDPSVFEFVGSEYAKLRGENPENGARKMVNNDRKSDEKLQRLVQFKEIFKRVFRYGRDGK